MTKFHSPWCPLRYHYVNTSGGSFKGPALNVR